MTQQGPHVAGVTLLEAYNEGFAAGRNRSDAVQEVLVGVMMSVLACAERHGIDLEAAMERQRERERWQQAG